MATYFAPGFVCLGTGKKQEQLEGVDGHKVAKGRCHGRKDDDGPGGGAGAGRDDASGSRPRQRGVQQTRGQQDRKPQKTQTQRRGKQGTCSDHSICGAYAPIVNFSTTMRRPCFSCVGHEWLAHILGVQLSDTK